MNDDFDWQEFFNYAKNVKDKLRTFGTFDGAQEALCRNGISRAYYAAFHIAKSFLESNSNLQRRNNEGSHEFVINALKKQRDNELKEIGMELDTLRIRRVRADYQADCYRKARPFDELEYALDSAEYISDIIYNRKLQLLAKKKS